MLILTVDPSLGRADYSTLSDQTLMEMLIGGFDEEAKKEYQDIDAMFLDVCEWPGIECDDDERVVEIEIDSRHILGSLELSYAPPKAEVLSISSWARSKLTGSVDLARLPEATESLCLDGNRLTGELDLTKLPDIMEYLSFNNNEFSGEVDLTQFPIGMKYLYLSDNQLTGSLYVGKLPPMMELVHARGNNFDPIVVVDSETHVSIKLCRSGVVSVVDENGKALDMERFWN